MKGHEGPLRNGPRKGARTTGRPPTVTNTGTPGKAANPQSPDKPVKRHHAYNEKTKGGMY